MMENRCIAISRRESYSYPNQTSDFRPAVRYPEYPWPDAVCETDNEVYDQVRSCFVMMGYDREHVGTPEWNPLRTIVQPGNRVLIKPNFVHDQNRSGDTNLCLYTQPAVIAPVIDYVILALGFTERGELNGRIMVADAPMQECNFDHLVAESGLDRLIAFYQKRGIQIGLVDQRNVVMTYEHGVPQYQERQMPSHIVRLDGESEFATFTDAQNRRLRKGANDPNDLYEHHHQGRHEYEVTDELLHCDVIINMPKPKTHKKAGVTIALKNMVGINVRKEFLPHYMEGAKQTGEGDAYDKFSLLKKCRAAARDRVYIYALKNKRAASSCMLFLRRSFAFLAKRLVNDQVTDGIWHGNATISKTIVDLNKICLYADKDGIIQDTPQRRLLIVADMVISGEGEGPVNPKAKNVGMIAVGEDPVCFDECIAALMGANLARIPTLVNARHIHGKHVLTAEASIGMIHSDFAAWDGKTVEDIPADTLLNYVPIPAWQPAFER